jgi:hypothetical protein
MADLITRAELLVYCPGLSTTANATLDAYIEAASEMVSRYCNREFPLANATERHPYRYSPRLYLKRTPIVSVSNITLYERSTANATVGNITNDLSSNMTETDTGYVIPFTISSPNGVLTVEPWTYRVSSDATQFAYFYEVNYSGGYANIPAPVKAATAKIVDSMNTRLGPNDGIQSEKIGDYSYTKFTSGTILSPTSDAGFLLAPYVRLGINGV